MREKLGLKKLGKLDWIARLRRETKARFDAVLACTKGQRVGRLVYSDAAFAVAVLKLHGYDAEAQPAHVLFAKAD